jgi:two-component system, OmpR family, response regulator MprA
MVKHAESPARTILVADDQPAFRRVIADTLTSGRVRVIEAADGQGLVQTALERRPDLILVNHAPDGPAISSTVHLLRAQGSTAHIPILLLADTRSGDHSEGAVDQVASAVDCCLFKPFSPLELVNAVDRLLEASEQI